MRIIRNCDYSLYSEIGLDDTDILEAMIDVSNNLDTIETPEDLTMPVDLFIRNH